MSNGFARLRSDFQLTWFDLVTEIVHRRGEELAFLQVEGYTGCVEQS